MLNLSPTYKYFLRYKPPPQTKKGDIAYFFYPCGSQNWVDNVIVNISQLWIEILNFGLFIIWK